MNHESTPRRLYWIDFPLLLATVGLTTWIFPTDTMTFVGALAGAGVGLYTLWEIIGRRAEIRFAHLFCIANLCGYGLGTVNSWLTLPRGNLPLARCFGRDPEAVATVMGAILICSGLLYALGELYEPTVFDHAFSLDVDNRTIVFVMAGVSAVIAGFAFKKMGFQGITSDAGHVGFFSELLSWIFPTVFAVTALCFLEWRGMTKLFLSAMLLAEFVLIIPTGRRNLIYFVLLAMIAVRLGPPRRRMRFSRRVIYASALAGAMALGGTAFYYLRYAGWSKHQISLPERISLAMTMYERGNTGKVNDSLQKNLEKRPFVLGYVSDLLDASSRKPTAFGANALHEMQLAIPSALYDDKAGVLYSEETVANNTFGFAYKDEANSVYSAGLIDFGFAGMLLYPVVIAFLFRVAAGAARLYLRKEPATIVILCLIYNALLTEAGLSTRFLAMRDSMIYAVFLWAIFEIPEFKLRMQGKRGEPCQTT